MPNKRQHLNSFPLGELEETTGTPLYYMEEDYPARPEIQWPLLEWSNLGDSESCTLEADVYVWRYALHLWCLPERRWTQASVGFRIVCTRAHMFTSLLSRSVSATELSHLWTYPTFWPVMLNEAKTSRLRPISGGWGQGRGQKLLWKSTK